MGHKKLVLEDLTKNYPDFLLKVLKGTSQKESLEHPIIVSMEEKSSSKKLEQLIKDHNSIQIIDNYAEQYAELLLSRHAHLYQANYDTQIASIANMLDEHYGKEKPWKKGSWVYYPWSDRLVHVLAQDDFETLRTVRNRDLITTEEQKRLYDFKVASFGMSVGSAGALGLALSGISRQIKLIDGAVISGSNLNRILTGVASVGKAKAHVIAQQIYEMNPYSNIEAHSKVTKENINSIFDKPWPVMLAIDEIDDIEMKVRIRLEARKRKIPVLMASELGDTMLLDVERFDLEPARPIFHGMIPDMEDLTNEKLANKREWAKTAVKILDPKNMPLKLQKSVLKIGTTIVTHPQLGSTVMFTGGVLSFAVKSIALGEQLNSGRYQIALEKELLANHKTRHHKRLHKKHTRVIEAAVKSMK
jgi:molybdopterin/thiamine biosynthesis adenylyltransferase